MNRVAILVFLLVIIVDRADAKVQSKTIEYNDGNVALEGYLAWDDAIEGKRPAVLVVHEWWGLNDYARKRADMLAELGYVAFALDMYGKGKVTKHPQEAGAWAGEIRKNVAAWQRRAQLGLDVLRKQEHVDGARVAAIGYCFGGATVMQIAYSGAGVTGVVSFHGSLPPATNEQLKNIRAKILVCHGADDSFVPAERIEAFCKALDEAKADWQMISYGGARHSFTNPDADKAGLDGLRYNKEADARSWGHMKMFLKEIFGGIAN